MRITLAKGQPSVLEMSDTRRREASSLFPVPRAELIGDNEIFLEHYRGILAYGKEEIHVDGGGWVLRILGRNLEIKAMRAGELRIFGVVTSLTLL